MYFNVTPTSTLLSRVDWQRTVTVDFSDTIRTLISYADGVIIVTIEYSSDIEGKVLDLKINFDPKVIKSKGQ